MYEIKNANCLDYPIVLDEFDHVITDPPYSKAKVRKNMAELSKS